MYVLTDANCCHLFSFMGAIIVFVVISYPINGVVKFSGSESMDDHLKKVTGTATKTEDLAKHKIPGKGL